MHLTRLLAVGIRPAVIVVGFMLATLFAGSLTLHTAFAEASLTITPGQGPAGTHVTVNGSGFSPNSPVSVTFDGGIAKTRPDIVSTDNAGSFEATFWIPFSIAEGTYPVVAKDFGPSKSSASTTFRVSDGNSPPVAQSQSVSVVDGGDLSVQLRGSDPDGDRIIFSIIEQPLHGSLVGFDPNIGTLTFSAVEGYLGPDRFTFKVSDGELEGLPAEVSITVVEADSTPVMDDAELQVQEDGFLPITLTAQDADSSALSFSILTAPNHGTLGELRPSGQKSTSLTYTPSADFSGSDSFTATVTDGINSDTATFAITVTPLQDAPLAQDGSVSTAVDEGVSISLTGTDPDGDPLTFIIGSAPFHGTLTGTAPNFTYQPDAGFSGTDLIVFKVNDGVADSGLARFTITVQGAAEPVVQPEPEVTENPAGGVDQPQEPVAIPPVEQPVEPVAEPQATPLAPAPAQTPAVQLQSLTPGGVDTVPPKLILPSSTLMFESQSKDGTIVTYNIAAIDDHDGQIPAQCYPGSGQRFPVGKINVVCNAVDSSGNSILEGFVVDVKMPQTQNVSPVIPRLEFSGQDITTLLPLAVAIIGSAVYVGYKVGKRTKPTSSQQQKSV